MHAPRTDTPAFDHERISPCPSLSCVCGCACARVSQGPRIKIMERFGIPRERSGSGVPGGAAEATRALREELRAVVEEVRAPASTRQQHCPSRPWVLARCSQSFRLTTLARLAAVGRQGRDAAR